MDAKEFALARLDDEVAVAQDAGGDQWTAPQHPTQHLTNERGEVVVYNEGSPSPEQAAHIACHDPARALREAAVLRALLAEHDRQETNPKRLYGPDTTVQPAVYCDCQVDGGALYAEGWPCRPVRLIVSIWNDCPGYDPAWRIPEPEPAPPPGPFSLDRLRR
ncbi:DUF6221 family protein [Spirillospora sp. CA-253888]